MALQLGLQILLPAFLLGALWRGAYRSRLDWLLNVLAVGAACLAVFLTARWDFSSYYLRGGAAIAAGGGRLPRLSRDRGIGGRGREAQAVRRPHERGSCSWPARP